MKVMIMASNVTITKNAATGWFSLKKIGDQLKFKASAIVQTIIAGPSGSCAKVRHPAIAIMMYSNVQTGAKMPAGGVNHGLARLTYHSPGGVKNPISKPPPIVRIRKNSSDMVTE